MGPALSQGLGGIRTWNPVASFKVLAALEEWQNHMDQRLVNRGHFTRTKREECDISGGMVGGWGLCAGRLDSESLGGLTFIKMLGGGEDIPVGGHSRGTLRTLSVGVSVWTMWGVIGGGLKCQVSVAIQGPLGRILAFITELVRSQGRVLRGIPEAVWREPRGVSRLEVYFWTPWELQHMHASCNEDVGVQLRKGIGVWVEG